jgi:hypothetical protein
MRYWIVAAALVLALAGCQTKKKTNEPAPDSGTESGNEDPVWREDQKTGEKTGEKQPADTTEKPADTGEQKASDSPPPKGDEPAPAKVDNPPKDPPPPETTTPKPVEPEKTTRPADPPAETMDPKAKEKLADEFVKAVKGMLPQLEKSKAYVQFKADNDAFSKLHEAALETRKGSDKAVIEQAWADTIKAWYEARYSLERFRKVHSNATDFETVSINSWNDVKGLRADHLRSADCRKANAASTLADPHRKELNMFRATTLKYDLAAGAVFGSKDWAKVFGDAQKKYEDAEQGKYDETDLKKFKD